MKRRLVFIVGLQKSGTTLLLRTLNQSTRIENPFKSEGNDFWGNEPPFTPCEFPAGVIYQRNKGETGHEIGEEDATAEVSKILNERLERLAARPAIIVNKNPYNTVRLPWLRKLFPDSIIIAMVRKPIPNIFSLYKKHIPHEDEGLAPEEGWWGVKPKRWRGLIHENKIIQCSRQWKAVNEKLWKDRAYLDMIVSYHKLCASPSEVINTILSAASGTEFKTNVELPSIRCFDLEYKKGSRLLSKNKYFVKSGNLTVPEEEPVEIEPFKDEDIDIIENICGDTASMIKELQWV